MEIDKIDTTILAELSANARVSMVDLATRVGLSSTAIARRQRSLEESGFIRGYQAVLDLGRFGLRTTVLVRIALESQSDQALKAFEAGVLSCPSVIRCFLMSGSDDYVAIVLARDIEDFERIHRTELSRLPRVARDPVQFRHARHRKPRRPSSGIRQIKWSQTGLTQPCYCFSCGEPKAPFEGIHRIDLNGGSFHIDSRGRPFRAASRHRFTGSTHDGTFHPRPCPRHRSYRRARRARQCP